MNSDSTTKKPKNGRLVVNKEASSSLAPPINVVCNFPSSSERLAYPDTPIVRRKQEKGVFSPVFNVDPSDYKDKGLREFLTWCGDKYKDTELFEAQVYEKLKEQDVGLDIFKDDGGIDAETLKRECDLTFGTAKRLVASYSGWELSKKKVIATYSGILHVLNWFVAISGVILDLTVSPNNFANSSKSSFPCIWWFPFNADLITENEYSMGLKSGE